MNMATKERKTNMGQSKETVNLDGRPVPLSRNDSPQAFLGKNGLSGRVLTKIEGSKEVPVQSMAEIKPGDELATVSESQLG